MNPVDLNNMPKPDLVREFVEISMQMSYAELRDQNEHYKDSYKLQALVANELEARGHETFYCRCSMTNGGQSACLPR